MATGVCSNSRFLNKFVSKQEKLKRERDMRYFLKSKNNSLVTSFCYWFNPLIYMEFFSNSKIYIVVLKTTPSLSGDFIDFVEYVSTPLIAFEEFKKLYWESHNINGPYRMISSEMKEFERHCNNFTILKLVDSLD